MVGDFGMDGDSAVMLPKISSAASTANTVNVSRTYSSSACWKDQRQIDPLGQNFTNVLGLASRCFRGCGLRRCNTCMVYRLVYRSTTPYIRILILNDLM